MFGPATVAGHPVHAILIAFPVALFSTSFLLDLLYFIRGREPFFARCSFAILCIGLLGTIVAALAGLDDYFAYHLQYDHVATTHLKTGLITFTLYAIQFAFRWKRQESMSVGILLLSLVGLGALGYQGWLGGELVYVKHVAIKSEAAAPGPAPVPGQAGQPAAKPLPPAQVAEATKTFNDQACSGCHRLPSGGGSVGPDLSHEGSKRDVAWIDAQIKNPAVHNPKTAMPPYGEDTLPAAKRRILAEFLASFR